MPSLTTAFWISFVVTLALLIVTLAAGWRRRRHRHLVAALCTVATLAVTIYLAERMGRARNFPRAEMAIHLWFAKSATFALLPVIVTGAGLWRRPRWRPWHRLAVALFLVLTVSASGTGIWVFGLSTPR